MLVDAAVGQLEKEAAARKAVIEEEALRAVKPDPAAAAAAAAAVATAVSA